jgi:hypothetical protein
MPRRDCTVTVCLIFLLLMVLVRSVAIAERACGMLLPSTACDYWVPAVAADLGHAEGLAASNSVDVPAPVLPRHIPSVVDAPSGEAPAVAAKNAPEVIASPAKHEIQIVSEKQRKRIASTRRYREASSSLNRGYRYRWNTWWPGVW